jgi:predicted nucleic acid-binding protein
MAGYVLDTSAIGAYLYDEIEAQRVEAVIFGGDRVLVPFIALMEIEYKLRRELNDELAVGERMASLTRWPVGFVESDPTWRRIAARVKAQGKISLADSWVAGLALLHDLELVHKDPEFDAVQGLKHVRLQYDRNRAGSGT